MLAHDTPRDSAGNSRAARMGEPKVSSASDAETRAASSKHLQEIGEGPEFVDGCLRWVKAVSVKGFRRAGGCWAYR